MKRRTTCIVVSNAGGFWKFDLALARCTALKLLHNGGFALLANAIYVIVSGLVPQCEHPQIVERQPKFVEALDVK